MDKVRYEEMLPHEIVRRRRGFPAAFIGLGGLEWHGEHLAVGNDALKAEKLCEMAAAQSGGFAFPTLWYGEPRVTALMDANHDQEGGIRRKMKFKKRKFALDYFGVSAEEQIEFYRALLYHTLVQMNTLEMRAVCLLCGHYPLAGFAQPAVERFNAEFADTKAFAATEPRYAARRASAGGDHAARWETSYLWHLRPDCVDMSVYHGRDDEKLIGVGGEDPRGTASIEAGRRGCEIIVRAMVRKAERLLDAAGWRR